MRDAGLVEVENASEVFLVRRERAGPGSVIVPTMEGTRPLLVEVQALATPTASPAPRRIANGFDGARLALLTAVLSKHARMNLSSCDVFVNVVGGLRITEPAADLGVALAIASSLRDAPVTRGRVAAGEVGLSGELRPVTQMDRRIREARTLGFDSCLVPASSVEPTETGAGFDLAQAATLREAIDLAL